MVSLLSTRRGLLWLSLLLLLVAGCNGLAGQTVATAPPQPSPTSMEIAGVNIPNLHQGQQAWQAQQCDSCHGPIGLGGIGPRLAATSLPYEEFLHVVRTAVPPKPAYTAEMLPDERVYDIYAWVRTQVPLDQPAGPAVASGTYTPSSQDVMGMTIWTSKECDTCHGAFAQGGPRAPVLSGLTYPVNEELARMRQAAAEIPEHGPENIDDDTFSHLYKWLQAGCSYTDDCSQ